MKMTGRGGVVRCAGREAARLERWSLDYSEGQMLLEGKPADPPNGYLLDFGDQLSLTLPLGRGSMHWDDVEVVWARDENSIRIEGKGVPRNG